jgi:hypothetical protein
MITRQRRFSDADWRERYGDCIADIVSGRSRLVVQRKLLQDAIVLRLGCGPERFKAVVRDGVQGKQSAQ